MPRVFTALFLLSWAFWGCQPAAPPEVVWAPEWEVQYSDTTIYLWALSIVDANTVWVAGTQGRVARTVGLAWFGTGASGVFSLSLLDDETGMAVGGKYNQPDSVYDDAAVTTRETLDWWASDAVTPERRSEPRFVLTLEREAEIIEAWRALGG